MSIYLRMVQPWKHWYWGQVLVRNPHRVDYVAALVGLLPERGPVVR